MRMLTLEKPAIFGTETRCSRDGACGAPLRDPFAQMSKAGELAPGQQGTLLSCATLPVMHRGGGGYCSSAGELNWHLITLDALLPLSSWIRTYQGFRDHTLAFDSPSCLSLSLRHTSQAQDISVGSVNEHCLGFRQILHCRHRVHLAVDTSFVYRSTTGTLTGGEEHPNQDWPRLTHSVSWPSLSPLLSRPYSPTRPRNLSR